MKKLVEKLVFSGKLVCKTGLHIGGADEGRNLTDINRLMIRRADNGEPYIPGSSLKGKMRSLVELVVGVSENYKFENMGNAVSWLFGALENRKLKEWQKKAQQDQITKEELAKKEQKYGSCPSRLIVRDAYLTKKSRNDLLRSDYTDTPFAEVKFENTINRVSGVADNPRTTERVPAQTEFKVEIILNLYEGDEKEDFISILKAAARLLAKDYLGGSGSRGYGKVKWKDMDWDDPKSVNLDLGITIEEE